MKTYLDFLESILKSGHKKTDRTGTGVLSLFGHQMRFDLRKSFPLLTTKKVHFKSVVYELLWFLSGDTNINYLNDHGVKIWDEWADENGDLGRIYGVQWRDWKNAQGQSFDQIQNVIDAIKKDPHSRRHLVVAYNPGEIQNMALPPCHAFFQFYVEGEFLSCQLYQRSADVFLGVPFNIASYAALTCMVAQVCGLKPKEFIHSFGDVHLYLNHIEQAKEQLQREPKSLPCLYLNPKVKNIFDFKYEDFVLKEYNHHPHIKAPVAI